MLLRLWLVAGILHGCTMMREWRTSFMHDAPTTEAPWHKAAPTLVLCPGLQLPGVLDELFTYSGPLGATITDSATNVIVWSPTAQHVSV